MLQPQAEEIIVEEQPKEAPQNRSKVFCVFCDKVPLTSAKLLTRLQKKKKKKKRKNVDRVRHAASSATYQCKSSLHHLGVLQQG